ncbi:hypothetical protein LBMAG29_09510 [Methylophilaceae bacterium]|nr:hypothetical protein LBMAG29_09510 [Methylophilaceae bacterium]
MQDLKNYVVQQWDGPKSPFFGIFDKENSTHIGNIKFDQIDFEKKFTVMGILIGHSLWRSKGGGEEVLKTTAKVMNTLGIKTIYLCVSPDNTGY